MFVVTFKIRLCHGVVRGGGTGWQLKMAALRKRLGGNITLLISNRRYSTASLAANSVILDNGNQQKVFDTLWLRDHCREGGRYSWETHQRETTLDIEHLSVDAKTAQVGEDRDKKANSFPQVVGDQLLVVWRDGGKSSYSLNWLEENYSRHTKKVFYKHKKGSPPPQKNVLLGIFPK